MTINKQLQEQFDKMSNFKLYRSSLTGQQVWDLYISSFKSDPIFRDPESSEHKCNLCNNFLRRYGNIVAINDKLETMTIFDIEADEEYTPVVNALSKALKKAKIADVFFETFEELKQLPYEKCNKTNDRFQLGVNDNVKQYNKEEADKFGVVTEGEIRKFSHLHLFLNKKYVDMTGKSYDSIKAEYRDAKNVFQRAMEEISLDTLLLVKDLINQGSLLDGTAHLFKIEAMIPLKEEYNSLKKNETDNWLWEKSYKFNLAKFRNELIGVLCTELSEGEELNKACQSWNKRVDPANYMKAVAPITKKQIEEAKLFVEENGYTESFNRRFATIDDIKVSEILHSNIGKDKIKDVSIFDNVKSTSTQHKRNEFENIEEVHIDKFMKDILPGCTNVEIFLKNEHEGNFVSLTTANNPDSKPIFKWNNNYSWTFKGNLAGKSQIKETVKMKGGNVEGVLRCSMIWNESGSDNSDLDLWCRQPDGTRIGFSTGYRKDQYNKFTSSGGQLDLDITNPGGKLAVENIYFIDLKKLKDGEYQFWVNPYRTHNSQGFKAEMEFDGQIFSYEYNQAVNRDVPIANVTVKNGKFTIEHLLQESGVSSRELYGLETNQFHKVNLICLSPNHWGDNNVGNKYYLFMIDKCKVDEPIRSFHNENLISELTTHRKVLDTLANVNMIAPAKKQLSGLGYNSTVNDEVIVKLAGTHKRMLKIKF